MVALKFDAKFARACFRRLLACSLYFLRAAFNQNFDNFLRGVARMSITRYFLPLVLYPTQSNRAPFDRDICFAKINMFLTKWHFAGLEFALLFSWLSVILAISFSIFNSVRY